MPKKNNRPKPLVVGGSEKKISEKSDALVGASTPKGLASNFPAKKTRKRIARILPSHRAIFENYKENGFRHMGKAIRKTGAYSESVAKRTNVITKSVSWKMLMDQELPEEHLALRHKEILNKRDRRKVARLDDHGNEVLDNKGDTLMEEVDDGPNTAAVTKGLELAYRLRGSFREKASVPASTVMYNLFYKPEVRDQMKTFEDGIRQSLYDEVAKKNQKDIDEEEEAAELMEGEIRDAEYEEGSGE